MDATEADDGAQLLGLFREPRVRVPVDDHDSSSRRLTQPVHAARTVLSSKDVLAPQPCSSGLFDVFADPPAAEVVGPGCLPASVAVFDLAATDPSLDDAQHQAEHKKVQDDHCTLLPPSPSWHDVKRTQWADVSDGEDSQVDVIADEATAEVNSQEHQSLCGSLASSNDLHETCALDVSDTKGYGYQSGPQSDIHVTGVTQAHVDFREFAKATLPDVFSASDAESVTDEGAAEDDDLASASDDAPALAPLGSQTLDAADLSPCMHAGTIDPNSFAPCNSDASEFVISLADALGLPEVSGEDDSKQGDRVVDGRPLPLRLPTVTGLQSSLAQLVDVSIGPNRASLSTRMHFLEKYAAATRQFELDFESNEQAQNTPLASVQAQQAPLVLLSDDLAPTAQCGPLPQPSMQTPCIDPPAFGPSQFRAAEDKKVCRGQHLKESKEQAQYTPLGSVQAQQAPLVLLADDLAPTALCGRLPQPSMQTPCKDPPAFGPSQFQAAQDMKVCRDQRLKESEEQAQYTPLVSVQAQQTPLVLDDDPAPTAQCGPLPQPSMQTPFKVLSAFGSSQFQAAKDKKVCRGQRNGKSKGKGKETAVVADDATRSRTQCGPLPQFGPSHVQTANDMQELLSTHAMPTPRTQCGPLPQQSMQTPFKDPSAFGPSQSPAAKDLKVRRGQRNGQNKSKGKDKGKAVVADDATRSSLKGYG